MSIQWTAKRDERGNVIPQVWDVAGYEVAEVVNLEVAYRITRPGALAPFAEAATRQKATAVIDADERSLA